jgi:hypothetical protein
MNEELDDNGEAIIAETLRKLELRARRMRTEATPEDDADRDAQKFAESLRRALAKLDGPFQAPQATP